MDARTATRSARPGRLGPPGEFVTAAGVRLHYVRAGCGRPVIYIHGAKSPAYDFVLSIGSARAERYTAVAFDRPGAGFSGRPPRGGGAPQEQAAVLRAAAAELRLERPVLIGHSLGAAVALAWALDAPAGVAAVVRSAARRAARAPPPARHGAVGRSPLGRPLVDAGCGVPSTRARRPPPTRTSPPRWPSTTRAC